MYQNKKQRLKYAKRANETTNIIFVFSGLYEDRTANKKALLGNLASNTGAKPKFSV